jgi:two-component system, chemotaxis family, chemotaxis protein CheY
MPLKSVLICADAQLMRCMMRKIVAGGGYEVVGEAEDRQRAIEMYVATWPDVVIIDFASELSAVEAVREFKRVDPDARIVISTEMRSHGLIADALEAGAHGFILKPFIAKRVLETLDDMGGGGAA